MSGSAELSWRHPTPEDIPTWAKLLAAAEAVDQTGEHLTEEDLEDDFADPNHDRVNAWFGFDGDGALGAWGWAWSQPVAADPSRVFLSGTVRPDLRRRGIGAELLAWLEEGGRHVHAALHPESDGIFELRSIEGNEGQRALAERCGYEPLRYWFEMRRPLDEDLPAVDIPAGLELRPYAPALDEAVRLAHNEAFADHWGSTAKSHVEWRLWYIGRNFRPDLSFVAMDGGEVAGYLMSDYYPADVEASGHPEAWVNVVGTRRRWRGRGVARALLASTLQAYRDAGLERGALGVDAANPTGALGLYERLGFRTHLTTISYAKPI